MFSSLTHQGPHVHGEPGARRNLVLPRGTTGRRPASGLGFCIQPIIKTGKESAYNAGEPVQLLGQEDPLEKGQATHYSIPGLPLCLSW